MNAPLSLRLHPSHPALTADELTALWRAAIKDDERLVDNVIQAVYDDLIAFDRDRAKAVMELMVRREPSSGGAFRALLAETRVWREWQESGLASSTSH